MPIRRRVAGMMLGSVLLPLVACGGGGGSRATAWAADTAEAVRVLRTPVNPFGSIYHPAVDLTKRPDTTKAAPPSPHPAGKARG